MAFRPGNHERAWNDPPVFSYQQGDTKPEESVNTARKTLLNKRIAFPLSGGSTTSQSLMTSLPPISQPPLAVNPSLPSQAASILLSCEKPSETPVETREQLESSLLMVSSILLDSLTNNVEQEKQEDFNKRLQHLYSSWREGKLNLDVRQRLATMCEFLEKRDFTRAENVRVALAVDYTSDCASWIMVIKNIITQMETKQIDL